jgi:hypothetical protein
VRRNAIRTRDSPSLPSAGRMTELPSPDLAGFWSYVRADDEADGKRISRLAELIRAEFTMITGREIEVFVDRDLRWGDEWKRKIDQALEGTAFFLAVITPRFFASEECRRELLQFSMNARSLGLSELLLSLLYVPVEGLTPDNEDEAKALVARMQYFDWTKLRFEEENSAAYREGINKLAARLAEIADALPNNSGLDRLSAEALRVDEDDAPGMAEILAEAEEASEHLAEHLEALTEEMEEISRQSAGATEGMQRSDAAGRGFRGRLVVLTGLAHALADPAERYFARSEQYAADLASVDAGVLTLIRLAEEGSMNDDPAQASSLFGSILGLAEAGRANLESMDDLLATFKENAGLSRVLRPPLNRFSDGIRRIKDGQAVMDEWARQIEQLPPELR